MKKLLLYTILIPAFLFAGSGISMAADAPAPAPELQPVPMVSDAEKAKAAEIYFNRCTGCHGVLRKGATGKPLTPDKTRTKTVAKLEEIIYGGTEGGMPGWGTDGILSREEANLLARYVQNTPEAPPEMPLKAMKETWNLIVPVDKRPTKPMTKRNWENFFGVILRDAGKVAVIDGDIKEVVAVLNTGFAVHTLRYSFSGRYLYTIGRDGRSTMIDLWSDPIQTVAEARTCLEARSIDTSKYKGPKGNFLDKLAIVGCYWPPSYVILDGQTLEPLKVVNTRGFTYDTQEYHPEVRVASIVASHFDPEWVINLKESGHVTLVDYSNINAIKETRIESERFLHDGGWDSTKRYFLVAANMRDKMVIVDAKEKKLVAITESGVKPHPGRGANFKDPKYGPVYATPHIGEPKIALISTDPKSPNAWKVVRELKTHGPGGLFVKSHPKSSHLWVDAPLAKEGDQFRSVAVYDIKNLDAPPKVIKLGDRGRAVHIEYNKAGDEVWVSLWDKKGEIVVFDDKTLKEKTRITDPRLVTPTGKFNVYNTRYDIY